MVRVLDGSEGLASNIGSFIPRKWPPVANCVDCRPRPNTMSSRIISSPVGNKTPIFQSSSAQLADCSETARIILNCMSVPRCKYTRDRSRFISSAATVRCKPHSMCSFMYFDNVPPPFDSVQHCYKTHTPVFVEKLQQNARVFSFPILLLSYFTVSERNVCIIRWFCTVAGKFVFVFEVA